jgi:hypothetical protein
MITCERCGPRPGARKEKFVIGVVFMMSLLSEISAANSVIIYASMWTSVVLTYVNRFGALATRPIAASPKIHTLTAHISNPLGINATGVCCIGGNYFRLGTNRQGYSLLARQFTQPV